MVEHAGLGGSYLASLDYLVSERKAYKALQDKVL
jgi:hypothetical protein